MVNLYIQAGENKSNANGSDSVRIKIADRMRLNKFPLIQACIAECVGTGIMIVFGCGVLCQVLLGDKEQQRHGTFISVSLGWGFAVALGVLFSGNLGSGNINPAITLGFAVIGKLPWIRVVPYMISQLLGAMIGALLVLGVYSEHISYYANHYDGGVYLVNTTGNAFVTNPHASSLTCFFDQIFGTALLMAGALVVTDPNGWKIPNHLHPLYFAFLVYTIIGCFALNAGCALNPARDLGPRLVLSLFAWGSAAFTSGKYFFWIPIVGPFIGAVIGAVLYEFLIGIHLKGLGKEDRQEDGPNLS